MPARETRPMYVIVWQVLNVIVFLLVLAANGLAGSGAMSGESIGDIATRHPSAFLPANYVFGIWSLIYLGLAAFTLFQVLPNASAHRTVRRIGPWWLVSGMLNIAWVSAFSFARFGLAMLVMVMLLVTLIVLAERVRSLSDGGNAAERLCVAYPFGVYLAWISVALIANTFQYAHVVEWSGLGLAEPFWSAIMMVVATLLGLVMVLRRGLWMFPPVVAWAVWGIGARFATSPLLHSTALTVVPLGLLGGIAMMRRYRQTVDR